LTEKKKSRGRPRVYPTNAARKKAYRERKKEERQELIKQVERLEKQLESKDEKVFTEKVTDPILSLTLAKIESMNSNELQRIIDTINNKLTISNNVHCPLLVILDDFLESNDLSSRFTKLKINDDKIIALEIQKNYQYFERSLSYLTIRHIIESEIALREHRDTTDYELDILERRITELEETVAKKKEDALKIKK